MYTNDKQTIGISQKQPYEMTRDEFIQTTIDNTPKADIRSFKLNELVNKKSSEHRQAVQNAFSEGKSVSQEVLKDYPDLAAKYKMAKTSR